MVEVEAKISAISPRTLTLEKKHWFKTDEGHSKRENKVRQCSLLQRSVLGSKIQAPIGPRTESRSCPVFERNMRQTEQFQNIPTNENVVSSEVATPSTDIDDLFNSYLTKNTPRSATTSRNLDSIFYEIENLYLTPATSNINIFKFWESERKQSQKFTK
jgi:hypothetical protein